MRKLLIILLFAGCANKMQPHVTGVNTILLDSYKRGEIISIRGDGMNDGGGGCFYYYDSTEKK